MFTCDVIKRALLYAQRWQRELSQFDHGDVSYRFNRKNDNVMLEFTIIIVLWFLHFNKYKPTI